MIIRAVIGGVVRFEAVAEVALVLSAVFANVSRVVALVADNVRGVGREVRSGDKSSAYSGELVVPTWTINGGSVMWLNGDFYVCLRKRMWI